MAQAPPSPDPELQEIAAYLAEALDAPIALIVKPGGDRSSILAGVGLDGRHAADLGSLGARAAMGEGSFEVPDAAADPRFANDPLVVGGPCVRFLAGVVFVGGALCVMGPEPRKLRAAERRALAFLARQAEARRGAGAEAHYRTLFESIDDGFCTFEMIFDAEGRPIDYRFLEVNDAFVAQTGLTRARALGGRTIREMVPGHEPRWFDLYGRVATTGEPLRIEDEAKGLGRRYEIHAFRIGGDGSREVGAIFKDVTARHSGEQAIDEERAFLDQTLRTADVATFDWDIANDQVFGNELMGEFYDLPSLPEGRPVAPYFEPIHPDDREAVRAAIDDALATGKRYEVQYRVRGKGGRERWVFARGDSARDGARATRLFGVVLDVTGRVEAETARQEIERRLRVALRGGRMGTWDVDLQAGTMVCSETCKANYGRLADDPFTYDDLRRAIFEADRPRWTRTVAEAIEAARDFEIEYRVLWPDESLHWVQVRGSCVSDVAGGVIGLSGVSFDVTERARADAERAALQAEVEMEQARLRAIFEQAPAIIAVLRGRDLVFDYANEGYYQTVGHRPMLGLTLAQALPEAVGGGEGRDYDRVLGHVFDTGERLTFSERPVMLQRTPGEPPEERYLDLAYQPIREADGAISGVLVHGIDVTDGVVARKAIAVREELFRTVFEQAPDDAILVMDRDRTITAWNPAAERISGWTAAEAIGNPADMIFTPEDVAAGGPAQETEGATRHGKAEDERWHMNRDGSRFWGSGTMNALHDAEGNVTGFLKVFRDATARYEEARALAFLRRFTDAIVDTRDPDEILSTTERMLGEHLGVERVAFGAISEDGATATVARDWTNGLASVVGTYRVADFSPQIVWNLAAGQPHVSRDSERDYAPGRGLEAVRALGSRASITTPILKEGRLVSYLLVHSLAPRDWTEDEIGLVKQVADRVTAEIERARAEAALREANQTLEARVEARTEELRAAVREAEGFNYSISHDLRTPLRAVVMTASVLLEEAGPALDEEQRDLLRRQVHNANRMGQLIDELLRLSRLARAEVQRRPLDMTAEARAVAIGLQTECVVEVQEGMVAEGDEGLVRTVLANLLENACKFSPARGTVRVGKEGGAFFVRDEGVGFDMQFAPKIFLPFERLVTEREFPGTGIGLANVKRIVERHGGRVWAESEPGHGATFFFTLEFPSTSP